MSSFGSRRNQALRDFEAARAVAPPASRVAASLAAARVYAQLGMASRMKEALAEFDRSVTDATARKRYADSRAETVAELAIAEGRWAEAVALARRADRAVDGPANSCVECLSRELLRVFAEQGVADSALAQYDAYRRTPYGLRPRLGPDLTVPARTILALARIYDARGDARNAAAAYRDYATRYERRMPSYSRACVTRARECRRCCRRRRCGAEVGCGLKIERHDHLEPAG